MTENTSSRKKFLQLIGLAAGATLLPTHSVAKFVDHNEILKLTPPQREFMLRYEQWMDEFIEVIAVQKTNPDDHENNIKMIALTEKAESFNPELAEFMKDETFAKIYVVSIERMSKEIV